MVMDMVSKLAIEKEMTVIITAHDPNMVLEYCTDVLMIKESSTLALGTIAVSYTHLDVYKRQV